VLKNAFQKVATVCRFVAKQNSDNAFCVYIYIRFGRFNVFLEVTKCERQRGFVTTDQLPNRESGKRLPLLSLPMPKCAKYAGHVANLAS
jgi:hypothetical protein